MKVAKYLDNIRMVLLKELSQAVEEDATCEEDLRPLIFDAIQCKTVGGVMDVLETMSERFPPRYLTYLLVKAAVSKIDPKDFARDMPTSPPAPESPAAPPTA